MVQRKNLYLIFKEAVNNAAKYAGCTKLSVRLYRDHAQLVLVVKDDGAGFEGPVTGTGRARGGGEGMGNMHVRAKEMEGVLVIRSARDEGTMVELRFKP